MPHFNEPISQRIWAAKYRYQRHGQVIDTTIEDTWHRVAKAIAKAEKPANRAQWAVAFYQILANFSFLPGGRILAGAGTAHKVTLFNCFVMDIPEDALAAIFKGLGEGAVTLQQGGGVGYDFSVLRPQGDIAEHTGIEAAGPVSFMHIWDSMCGVLVSTGARRGAMMGVLRVDHPDIETFISAKREARALRHFNVSVNISDEFMHAVQTNADWALVFPTHEHLATDQIVYRSWGQSQTPVPCRIYRYVKARQLWEQIIRSAYDYAEPGVIFGDTINRTNTLWYREQINATNPCGEIPLPPYGACDLGAINLPVFVRHAFQSNASIDWQTLEKTVRIATRFLDNVIDVSRYPLNKQRVQAEGTRRIGLGITGLADVFVMLNMRYGSQESIQLAQEIMRRIVHLTWETSIELAREKGSFPFFTETYLQGEFVQQLPASMQQDIAKHGMRNSHHNTIAPTGTISLLANNISNGVEPIFMAKYDRHVRTGKDEKLTFSVQDYAYRLWRQSNANGLPPAWMDTQTLTPDAHLNIQAAVQPFIDNAISKTINIPHDFPLEKLMDVYSEAYTLGLKGCTIFRPNPVTGSVLEVPEEHCCQFETEERDSDL